MALRPGSHLPFRTGVLVAFCAGGAVLIAASIALRAMPITYRGARATIADGRQVREVADSATVLLPANGWRPLRVSFEARAQGPDTGGVSVEVSADGTVLGEISTTPEWGRHDVFVNTPVVFPRHVEIRLRVASAGQRVAVRHVLLRHELRAWHTAKLFLLGGIAGVGVWLAARGLTWRPPLRGVALAAAIGVYLLLVTRVAWIGDDAYITFRTIENLLAGNGLRWNVAERVQAFTHPLWLALLVPARVLAGEPYVATLAVSYGAALAAFCILLRVSSSTAAAMLAAILLVLSRSFVDYSTSGLENPLLFLLLGLFYLRLWSSPPELASPILYLLASLIFLTRPDAILLILPALALNVWHAGPRRAGLRALAGFAPAVAWVGFSLWYYGFPVPNTAPAKLSAGIPTGELAARGLAYLRDCAAWDPIVIPAAILAVAAAVVRPSMSASALLLGAVLYCAYLVKIGGDFMVGRLIAAPMFVSVLLVARTLDMRPVPAWLRLAAIGGATAMWCVVFPESLERLQRGSIVIGFHNRATGVVDERWNYYSPLGLLSRAPSSAPALLAGFDAKLAGRKVALRSGVGLFGFAAGPRVHVLDTVALGDPLLARLPANPPWRPGHLERRIPDGYIETLETGVNTLRDPRLARFYDDLSLVTRGPLWSLQRLRTVAALNLGRYGGQLPQEILAIESPAHEGTVSPPFVVSGWALDRSAASGTGVAAVHVYAYPRSLKSGHAPGEPIALGLQSYGEARPDLAGSFGTQFTTAGYRVQVPAGILEPGVYHIVVYARSAATQLANARSIRVTIE